jgi:hypothetical protein
MRNARSPLEQVETVQLVKGWAVSLFFGTALGCIVLLLSGFGFFMLLAAFVYGTAMATIVLKVTNRKRGRVIELMALGSAVGGLLLATVIVMGGLSGLAASLTNLWYYVMVVVAGYTAFNRTKYY